MRLSLPWWHRIMWSLVNSFINIRLRKRHFRQVPALPREYILEGGRISAQNDEVSERTGHIMELVYQVRNTVSK